MISPMGFRKKNANTYSNSISTNDEDEENKYEPEKSYLMKLNNQLNHDPFEFILDRAFGIMIGAAIGDSIGSYCEFNLDRLTINQLDNAMKMNGGGPHYISSGQVTDDTELTISLTNSLIEMKNGIN